MMHNKSVLVKGLIIWLPFALVITILSGLVYVAVQQNFRMSANDPQIQLVQDAAVDLGNGAPAQAFTSQQPTNLSKSLAPFILVFDDKGQTVSGTAQLDGKLPQLPSGVFDYAKAHGENRFTWQPNSGIRQAMVLDKYESKQASTTSTGFVAVGRSLREVEVRVQNLTYMVLAAWLASLVTTLLAIILGLKMFKPATAQEKHLEPPAHT